MRARGTILIGVIVAATAALWPPGLAGAEVGDITTYPDPQGDIDRPHGIAAGPDGNLWFTSLDNDRIGRIDPDTGVVTLYIDPEGNVDGPFGIATGSDGNLWFASSANDRVGRIDPDTGEITTFVDPQGDLASPFEIISGPEGDLWFTSTGNQRIGRIDPATGTITTYPSGAFLLRGIGAGPDGRVWFTSRSPDDPFDPDDDGAASIGRLDPTTGDVSSVPDPDGEIRYAEGIGTGPDGNVWFTMAGENIFGTGLNRIGRVDPATNEITVFNDSQDVLSQVENITTGPDGRLWFNSRFNNRIGAIDPATGTISAYTVGPDNLPDGPFAITTGPDCQIWFTSVAGDPLGRVDAGFEPAGDGCVAVTNAAPIITGPGPQRTSLVGQLLGQRLVLSRATGNGLTVSDPDAGAAEVRVTVSAARGRVSLATLDGLTFETGDGANDREATFRDDLAAVNRALDGLSYRAPGAYLGPDAVTITVDDQGHTGGPPQSATFTVPITVSLL